MPTRATRPPAIGGPITVTGKISWNHSLRQQALRRTQLEWGDKFVYPSTYRPFSPQWAYVDSRLNDRLYQLASMFPTPHHTNTGIVLTGAASHFQFTPFITDLLPNLHLLDTAQFFPRWTYEKVDGTDGGFNFADDTEVDEYGYRRVDNVTDEILSLYRQAVGPHVSKDHIFWA